MIDSELDFIVANFSELENKVIECMEYIPFIDINESVVSPKFVPVLMEACSLIESIFRHNTSEGGRLNLKKYSAIFEPALDLEGAKTLFLTSQLHILTPFENWLNTSPEWWDAYNRVKHDRIGHYSESTYSHTISALAALHQVISRSEGFLAPIAKAGWFNESDRDGYSEMRLSNQVGCRPPEMPIESKLFVSATRGNFVKEKDGRISIDYWEFSDRVRTFIWVAEGWM
ncbi:hypothetical protein [Teredinibacter turnerae]|uniref:hypothetical protein n=1 Tax=Teredinibacter turnerae TaxID=2426 RepID=UPI0004910075|nr:hypothetical protein [Teredinibacter turnerae]